VFLSENTTGNLGDLFFVGRAYYKVGLWTAKERGSMDERGGRKAKTPAGSIMRPNAQGERLGGTIKTSRGERVASSYHQEIFREARSTRRGKCIKRRTFRMYVGR